MNLIMRLIVTSVVAFGLSYLLAGIKFDSFWSAIIVAIVLAILNCDKAPYVRNTLQDLDH